MPPQNDNTEAAAITYFVNNVAYASHHAVLTGSQIKTQASVPADYELFEVRGDQTIPIGNDEPVTLEHHKHFRAIPAGTFGTYDAAA